MDTCAVDSSYIQPAACSDLKTGFSYWLAIFTNDFLSMFVLNSDPLVLIDEAIVFALALSSVSRLIL